MLTWQGGLAAAESAYPARLKPDLWLAMDGQGVLVGSTSGTYSGRLNNEAAITGALVGTETISEWRDKSKSGNHFSQGVSSGRPEWVAASENGFSTAALSCLTSDNLSGTPISAAAGFSIVIAAITNNVSAGARTLFSSTVSSTDMFMLVTGAATLRAGWNGGSGWIAPRSITLTADTPYVLAYTFDGTSTGVLRRNGTVASGTTDPLGNSTTVGMRIGSNSTGSNTWVGQVAEVIVRAGATVFTTTELGGLEAYLAAKYGISI